jgi:hypothetical protein
MSQMRLLLSLAVCLSAAWATGTARADDPVPDPLRVVPTEADLFIKVDHPRRLIETVLTHPTFHQARQLAQFRDFFESATVARFEKLIAYYEKDLGMPWRQIVDQAMGGGVVVAAKVLGTEDSPVLLATQSRDRATLEKLLESVIGVLEEEISRDGKQAKVARKNYRGAKTFHLGDDLHAALIDGALLVSNKQYALKMGIDRAVDRQLPNLATANGPQQARKLLDGDVLAWGWVNLAPIQAIPEVKENTQTPNNNALLTLLFGGWIDSFRRSPFAAVGIFHEPANGLRVGLRMPAGLTGGNAAEQALTTPTKPGEPATLPLLQPKGTLFTQSFYWDLSILWKERAKIFNAETVKQFEEANSNPIPFLPGQTLATILEQTAPQHRLVVATTEQTTYRQKPALGVPAFAFVTTMRDPQLAKTFEAGLRALALFGGNQLGGLKLVEQKHQGVNVVGYLFDEKGPPKGALATDVDGVRFAFSPCFATVGDQFIICSRLELIRELIEIIQKEDRTQRHPAAGRMRFSGQGLADLLYSDPAQLLTQTILDQALPDAEARQYVETYLGFLRDLGQFDSTTEYRADQFRFDIRWTPRKAGKEK